MLRLLRLPRVRALALLVQGLALFCQLAEGTGREHCPHHDLPAAAVAMAHMAGHEHHQPGSPTHGCRCLGDCATIHSALPAPAVASLPETWFHAQEPGTPAGPRFVATAQYRLPPALGPPLSA